MRTARKKHQHHEQLMSYGVGWTMGVAFPAHVAWPTFQPTEFTTLDLSTKGSRDRQGFRVISTDDLHPALGLPFPLPLVFGGGPNISRRPPYRGARWSLLSRFGLSQMRELERPGSSQNFVQLNILMLNDRLLLTRCFACSSFGL